MKGHHLAPVQYTDIFLHTRSLRHPVVVANVVRYPVLRYANYSGHKTTIFYW